MKKGFVLSKTLVYIFTIIWTVTSSTNLFATETDSTAQSKVLRMIDTKEEYGRSCESYSYITPLQRLQFIKHSDFMLGDILSESLSISSVEPEHLVDSNLTECRAESIEVSEYIYKEELEYLGEHFVTLEVVQYAYGAGAAHGNSHISHYVYEREYGMEVNWKDLFGKNDAFELYVLKRVVDEIASKEFIEYFKTSDQLLNFKKAGYFAITDEGLLIQYGKYEITPGASGLPSLVIPKEVLKQYMSQEIYGKCFLTQKERIAEVLNEF
jgi:hypothetical protein